jgi:hypothetical protein
MSAEADRALMAAILTQIEVGKINFSKLAQDLNLPTKTAASMRWYRFKARLNDGVISATSTPAKIPQSSTAAPSTTPNKSAKGNRMNESPSKKRKRAGSDIGEKDDSGLDIKGEVDWENVASVVIPETPPRRLPFRKARVTTFKEEDLASEDEEDKNDVMEESEQEAADVFTDRETMSLDTRGRSQSDDEA